ASLVEVAALSQRTTILAGAGAPAEIASVVATTNLFDVTRALPLLGRLFRTGDDVPGAHRVAVLSHAAWWARFGGNPDVVGTSVTLDGDPFTIVGVLPAGF